VTLWAWALAEQYLARVVPRRWAHVQGVARVGLHVGEAVLNSADRDLLVAAALLHDIGYAPPLVDSGYHPLDGARFIVAGEPAGEPGGVPGDRPSEHLPHLANLVANHSAARFVAELRGFGDELTEFPDERNALRDALWYCDMRVGPAGHPVTFEARIADIRARHGAGSFLVRALDAGALDARRDAVRRTELRLAQV
jgi:HD domain-containing protein